MKRFNRPIVVLLLFAFIITSMQIYTDDNKVLAAETRYEVGMDRIKVTNGTMSVYAPEVYNVTNPDADTSAKAWNILKSSGQLPVFVDTPSIKVASTGKTYGFNFKIWNDKHIVVYGKPTDVGVNPRITAVNGYKDWKTKKDDSTCGEYYLRGSERGEYRYHGYDMNGNRYSNTQFPIDGVGQNMNEYEWIYKPWVRGYAIRSVWNDYALKMYDYFLRDGKPSSAPAEGQKIAQWISNGFIKDEADTETHQPVTTLNWDKAKAPDDLGEAEKKSNYNGKLAYNYANVMSAPTPLYPGEAKMFIEGGRYRTSFIPAFADKLEVKPSAEIKVLKNEMKGIKERDWDNSDEYKKYLDSTVEVELQVISTLPDKDIYNDPIKKTIYFNRNDMLMDGTAWRINLTDKSNLGGVPNASWNKNTTYYVEWQGDGNAHGKANYTITMKVSDILRAKSEGKTGIDVSYKSTARFYSKENKSAPTEIGSQVYTATIPFEVTPEQQPGGSDSSQDGGNTPVLPPEQPVPDFITPEINLPEPAFDIVNYKPTDNTAYIDASGKAANIINKEVFVDGKPVSYDEFFSGNYTFGECGYDRLSNIIVVYTAEDGSVSFASRWIRVLNTKPRVQFLFSGDYKQNRKQSLTNTSESANTKEVIETYPIVKYEWTVEAVGGGAANTDIRAGTLTDMYREFTFKKPGSYKITLVGTNTLNRRSDPYEFQFEILSDIAPAVICELDNVSLARGETVKSYYFESVSTDGDSIESTAVQLYYDADNNGVPETLINTWNNVANGSFPEYTVSKLGMYRYKITSKEKMEGSFIDDHVTAADAQVKIIERDFWVDNYVPQTGIYTDIPIVRTNADVFILTDSLLAQDKINYVSNGRMDFNNYLRTNNIIPVVEHWDLKTYTYSQPASTYRSTGTSYPPSSVYYSSNGYSGTLYRTSVSDNGSSQDFGSYQTKTETKTATGSYTGYNYNYYVYTSSGWSQTSSNVSNTPSISYSDSQGFSGTLYKNSTTLTYDNGKPSGKAEIGATYTRVRYYDATYSGTVSRTVTYWVSDWRWVPSYRGYYSGTIYKYVKEPYTDPFRTTSYKYVVYVTGGIIKNLTDLKMVLSKSGAKLILIGNSTANTQIASAKFIPVTSRIETDINNALNFIIENNPTRQDYYVLAGVDPINLKVDDLDQENDPIVDAKFQYVQNANYFDNTQGMETFAVPEFSTTSGWTSTNAAKLNKVGKYTIYRRIKDQPTTDTRFAGYSYYSGTPSITIYAHRKPIAWAALDWTFDMTDHRYNTTWVDSSYDLDHQYSRTDKGIVEKKIIFRQVGADWSYVIPAELSPGTYELQYFVKDVEGVWSDPFVMNFTLLSNPPPKVDANPTSKEWTNANVTCTITANDPSGDYAYTNYMWSTSAAKLTSGWKKNTGSSFNVTQTMQGIWYLHMEAFDAAGNKFYRMRGPYKIDKTPPTISANPATLTSINPVTVTVTSGDTGGSGLKYTNYKWTTTTAKPTSGWTTSTVSRFTTTLTDYSNVFYLHTEAFDNAGNVTYRIFGPYKYNALKITDVSISGYWNHWRGQIDLLGNRMTNEPHRFLSLEKVRIEVTTIGDPDKIEVSFSPELESMLYTDPKGNTYDYGQQVGCYVSFPHQLTVNNNTAVWEYILPLAPSTKDWNNKVLGSPYWMKVIAYKGTISDTYIIADINITGNTYDLIYIQPVD